MRRKGQFGHRFVTSVPQQLEDGLLYVSIDFATAVHLCACGCKQEVVTPLTPTDWKLIFDGESVSLYPSVGNWSFPCRSHYWVRQNWIVWAGDIGHEDIKRGREFDRQRKLETFSEVETGNFDEQKSDECAETETRTASNASLLERFMRWFS